MSTAPSPSPVGRTQRSALLHAGGWCELRCVVCDCTAPPSPPSDIARALQGGGARLVVRGATEHSLAVADIIRRARAEGYAEIVLRTNATWGRTREAAASFARVGADAALVPLFSHKAGVHDRIAGRSGALAEALTGMKHLAQAGLAIEIEVPILPLRLQNLEAVVRLARQVVPALRAVRFFVPPGPLPTVVAPPSWDGAGQALAKTLLVCRELGIKAPLSANSGVPLCALRDYPDLYDVYALNPKARSSRQHNAMFGTTCESCAVRPQCPGLVPSYWEAHGEAGTAAYTRRPPLMYEQRTTRRRVWTPEQRVAASRAEILVLRPTVNCNQDCTFCSANETSSNVWTSHAEMLRAIARAARRGIEWVSFSGGEPTLSKHLVEYIRCARRLGITKIEIISNAVLLDKKEKVTALVEAGLTDAFISLHAHDEELSRQSTQKIGDFARTVQGIQHLVEAGTRTAINHVITARNYPYLLKYVEFVHREFGGKPKISFAFVTPQFKALDNIEVMPKLSLVMPHLKRAMYRALDLGQPFTIGSRQGIPFCFLDEFRAWSDGIKLSNSAIAEDAHQKQRGPGCDECRFSNYCTGLWRPYVAKFGLDELRPVPGPKLTDRDVNSSAAMIDLWGGPPSFDAVPEALRARELETGPPVAAAADEGPPQVFVPQRSRPLRLAMLGSGRQARRLARAARGVPGLSIDAVASPHALQADLHDFGDCPAYADAAEAIDDIRPEAVIIAAATTVHYELARLAIERGIPALLEKPIASNEEQAMALAAVPGARIVPAHNTLYASGLDELLALPLTRPAAGYVWRRTRGSGDTMRTWSRSFLYETVYHVLVVIGRALGGGVGEVMKASFRGDAAPEYVRLELRYGDAPAEVALDFGAALEEDVVSRREADLPATEQVWRRHGRAISITGPSGERSIEARGGDVERMLINFRDFVLGKAPAGASVEEGVDVMRTARRIVEALDSAGAPFDRPNAPRHVASRVMQSAFP